MDVLLGGRVGYKCERKTAAADFLEPSWNLKLCPGVSIILANESWEALIGKALWACAALLHCE